MKKQADFQMNFRLTYTAEGKTREGGVLCVLFTATDYDVKADVEILEIRTETREDIKDLLDTDQFSGVMEDICIAAKEHAEELFLERALTCAGL